MAFNIKLHIFLLLELITITYQSITGVTYMDHFDFEERYNDANECNPLYWHPLHLPRKCMKVFQKIIRSKLASHSIGPVRIVNENEYVFNRRPHRRHSRYESIDSDMMEMVSDYGYSRERLLSDRYIKSLPPYERMLALLNRDAHYNPTAPIVGMVPHIGPVAVYQQPVSKQSETMMKTIAKAYAEAGQKQHGTSKGYLRIFKEGKDGKFVKERDDFDDDS